MLEVIKPRATDRLQHWWRSFLGIQRHLEFIRARVVVGTSVNSHTLCMKARVLWWADD